MENTPIKETKDGSINDQNRDKHGDIFKGVDEGMELDKEDEATLM
jgi:hypothetical protein